MEDFLGIKKNNDFTVTDVNLNADCRDFGRTVFPYAMAYVPIQKMTSVYPEATALERGTLYPELDKPFLVGK